MKRKFIFITCALATISCWAQVDSTKLSLKECLTRGLKNNYDVQIATIDQNIAEANATRANAGQLPTVSTTAGYTLEQTSTRSKNGSNKTSSHNIPAQTLNARLQADWTIFDGFKIQTNYQRLKQMKAQSEIRTRIELEDYVASAATAYYNIVRQQVRMKNMRASLELSRERLRIVSERYKLGSASRLDLRSAEVDFNADSTQVLSQQEALIYAILDLQEMMGAAAKYYDGKGFLLIYPTDTVISLLPCINIDSLEQKMLQANSKLLNAAAETRLSELDYKAIKSRDFPYLKLSAGYGYTHSVQNSSPTQKRDNWGGEIGVTVGMKIFDGNRKRERHNALAEISKSELTHKNLELTLRAQLERLWKSYKNNQRLLGLAEENLEAAGEHHEAAQERFMLGALSGIEMRQAEQNLLDARESLLNAQYNMKICEISLLNLGGQVMQLTQ